ncbi:RND family transporter [Mycobacterium sp.]|uniref:MMPL/RND family transporter n=1 Tax=Mycobacterium sp. TaxID=1785 RepID=UPI003A8B0BFE
MTIRFIQRFALLIVGFWALAAVVGNSLAPPLERVVADADQPYLPSGTPTALAMQRAAKAFAQAPTDNIGYVVLVRNGILGDQDRQFYGDLLTALRSDSGHVLDITDWWRVPATAPAAVSEDKHMVIAPIRLGGLIGTTEAIDSINSVRGIVASQPAPEGMHVYVTGPGATIMDEFDAVDRQSMVITAATFLVLLILLLIVYRSLITAMVPLVSVAMALAVAKPVISDLGSRGVVSVSQFSLSVSVAMAVGAGTGLGIFLLGRYHERRRQQIPPAEALADAYRGVAPAIAGSVLIVVAPLVVMGWLSIARISMLATTGLLFGIGVIAVGASALTLTPALISLAGRNDLSKPPRRERLHDRYRRIGVQVARWPAPILVSSGVFVFILILALHEVPIGWDETTATSPKSESRRTYELVNRHFPPNQLFPDVVTIETSRDIRTPAGLAGIERVTSAIMGISGVRMVQSASHPGGMVSKQASLTPTGGNLGDLIDIFADRMAAGEGSFVELDAAISDLIGGLDMIQAGPRSGNYALGGVSLAINLTQTAISKIRAVNADVSDIFNPLRSFVASITECRSTPVCVAAQEVLQWATDVTDGSTNLIGSTDDLLKSIADATGRAGLPDLDIALMGISAHVEQVRAEAAGLRVTIASSRPVPTPELASYLRRLVPISQGGPGVDLYSSRRILTDPNMRPVLNEFFSPNGRATRLYVYGNGREWGHDGARRARTIAAVVADTTRSGPLRSTGIELTGVGPVTRDLQDSIGGNLKTMVGLTLGVILLISALLLRSLLAGTVLLGTLVTSYLCALGASALILQRILNHPVLWTVPPIAFVSMLGVASGANLVFVLRVREGLYAGLRTSVMRASAATGGAATAGGLVVGIPLLALAASRVTGVAQIGVTVGLGLLLNALVVRTFVLPALMVVLDRWLWWSRTPAGEEEQEYDQQVRHTHP